jgi:hypothetical protein
MLRHDVVVKLNGTWMTVYNVRAATAQAAAESVCTFVPGAEAVSAQVVPHSRSGEDVFALDMRGQTVAI